MSINNQLKIGDLTAKLPIIQGGMGVGVSRSSLAGAVAKEGGVGIISTAQIGYDEEADLRRIRLHVTTEQSTSISRERKKSRREMVLSV